jgi:hypothetical protein
MCVLFTCIVFFYKNMTIWYTFLCTVDIYTNGKLTPWNKVLPEKLTRPQLVKKFSILYGFRSACHLSISWARWIQFMPPYPTSWRSNLMLSSHLCVDLPVGPFLSVFPTKTLYVHLLSRTRVTCPSHLVASGKFSVYNLHMLCKPVCRILWHRP